MASLAALIELRGFSTPSRMHSPRVDGLAESKVKLSTILPNRPGWVYEVFDGSCEPVRREQ